MKVLIVNSVCGIGSTGKIVVDLAKDFIKNGDECIIAYGREKAPKEYEGFSYRIGNDLTVRINGIKARLFDNEGFNAKFETKKFIKWAEEYNPDLVWLHNLHGYYINVEYLFNWIKSRPSMQIKWTLHDCWAFTGHCCHFEYANCYQWTSICRKCDKMQKRWYPASIYFNNCYKNFLNKKILFQNINNVEIITPSYWLERMVRKSFLKDYCIKTINNSIDKDIFRMVESSFYKGFNIEKKFKILGVSGVWNQRKGLDDFIKLRDKLDDSYSIILVGLNKRKKECISKGIIVIDKIENQKILADIYSASDCFLNLTYEDTYPTVNLEAQSCGIACLTYDSGGSAESVEKCNVIEKGNINSLVTKIEKLKKEKDKTKKA